MRAYRKCHKECDVANGTDSADEESNWRGEDETVIIGAHVTAPVCTVTGEVVSALH